MTRKAAGCRFYSSAIESQLEIGYIFTVLLQREIYVTAALLAATAYVVLAPVVGADAASLIGFVAGAALRIAAMVFGWALPPYFGGLLWRSKRSAARPASRPPPAA